MTTKSRSRREGEGAGPGGAPGVTPGVTPGLTPALAAGPTPGLAPFLILFLTLGLALGGCARTIGPTGGDVPELPPRVVSTSPEDFALVAPFDGPVRIEFERTLSERTTTGSLRDAVVVSPLTGEVTVSQRGRRLEIRMEGGFRSEAVYRITVLPRFQDRFRNPLDRPVELFFSTGPEFDETLVAGLLTDRLSGDEVAGARVDAVPLAEGPTYSAMSDSTGVFAFRYLPPGDYRVTAWDDMNRNREPDFTERQADTRVSVAPADTLVITTLELLQPDTTAAVLRSAQALDSLAVELTFDDPLDPEASTEGVRAMLDHPEDAEEEDRTRELPRVLEVLHPHVWEERQAAAEAAAAAAAARAADPDAPDPEIPEPTDPDDPDEAPDELAAEEPVRPGMRLVLVLDRPLPADTRIVVRVEGVENLAGIPDGGGEVAFTTPEAPAPPEADPPPNPDPDQDPPGAPDPPAASCAPSHSDLPSPSGPPSQPGG